ncbi:hypothetical protein RD792_017724, partial [Penstemon davidsonii]
WFMPVNIGITFLIGGTFGWIAVKIIRPKPHLGDLIIAMCASGNLGNILLIIVPAICQEDGNPFGDKNVCSTVGLSYVSFSMALGAFYIWTYTYHLIRSAGTKYEALLASEKSDSGSEEANKDLEANEKSLLLKGTEQGQDNNNTSTKQQIKNESNRNSAAAAAWSWILGTLHQLGEELRTPPIIAAIFGLIFGSITWLRNLIIGNNAPLRVIDDSIKLLGDGTIPSITLILGGNLTQGLRKAKLRSIEVIAVICVRYLILPVIGIFVVKGASHFGFLPSDPLFHFVLLVQFTLPPAMNIALALTGWSTVFMWILS